jgi:hypothetical protein
LVAQTWPFLSRPEAIETLKKPSLWQYLFSDPTTLGLARLAIVFGSLFIVVSVIALGIAGRWMSGFGGLTVDERESAEERISDLEDRLRTTEEQLEEEVANRIQAEDWADQLIEEIDQAQIELEAAREEAGEDD